MIYRKENDEPTVVAAIPAPSGTTVMIKGGRHVWSEHVIAVRFWSNGRIDHITMDHIESLSVEECDYEDYAFRGSVINAPKPRSPFRELIGRRKGAAK